MPLLNRLSRRTMYWFVQHRRLLRRLLVGFVGLAILSVVGQLMYPSSRVLPSVAIAGQNIGGQSQTHVVAQLNATYAKAKVVLKAGDKTFTRSFAEIGIDPRSEETVQQAAHYSFAQRLVPFSSLFIMVNRDTPLRVRIDDERLRYFAEQVEKEAFVPAENASITVKGDDVRLVSAKPSKTYPTQRVVRAIKQAAFQPSTVVRVTPQTAPAERTDQEVQSVLHEAKRAINTPLTLTLGDETISVEKATIGSWLDFTENPASKQLELTLKAETVKKYLDGVQKKIYKAPGTTRVQLIDGREVSRTNGEPGRGIDADKTLAALKDAINKGTKITLTVPIAVLPAKVVYDRQYSNGDAGLTALLADLAGSKGYGISVMELGGRSANINGNKQFVAASTYKLFVAYAVFKQIEAGQMKWSDSIAGRTVEGCFEVMIVRSDNPCAKALGDRIGWQRVEDMMKTLGLNNTELSPQLYTTANDLALFLYKLENGSLLSAGDKARLVDAMKRQIYRSGIPAGTGLTVADKVGFIDSYIHDAGIVYGAKGPYVLVIMTSGSSWSSIADAARQINTFLNR